jgi:hypothetical protein
MELYCTRPNPKACDICPGAAGIQSGRGPNMAAPRFIHDDVVQVKTGAIGTVKEVHQRVSGYIYGVQLRTDAGEQIDVPEAELELVKIANSDETGFHLRYIT